MLVYYGILRLSGLVLSVGILFSNWSSAIRDVWLIGDNLSGWLSQIASKFFRIVVEINGIANDYLRFIQDLQGSFSLPYAIQRLIQWADDLISLVRYFNEWVDYALQRYFPALYNFARNPGGTLVNLLNQYTGFDASFIANPRAVIRAIINAALGGVQNLINNPGAYIRDVLRFYFPRLMDIANNPDGWLLNRVLAIFPEIRTFAADPDGYILDKIRRFVDQRLDQAAAIAKYITIKILEFLW
jgi:hypothetical protein